MSDKILFIILFSGIWCFVGIVFLIVSKIISSVQKRKERVCTSKAIGTVIDTVRSSSNGNGHYGAWYPIIQYITARGENIVKRSLTGANPPKYKRGENVYIHYNPNRAEEFYIDGDGAADILKKVFLIVGILAVMIGVVVGILFFIFA